MLRVDKLIPGGFGLATNDNGKKILLWNALPGEEVSNFIVTKNKSSYIEAIATKITTPSEHRIAPKDLCYLSTSPWQIMDYTYELQQKQSLIVELFREHQINIATPEIITDGRDYFYRNKMEYALYYNKETEKINLAFHARGSHRKIPIVSSSIERPEIFTRATAIIDELNYHHDEARKYQSLLLRCNQTGEVSGGLYKNHHPHPHFPTLTDKILRHEYSYSPNGFFQINLPVYELALEEIAKHITTNDVLDLYAGVGTIGLSVARDKNLTLVECDKSAYTELECNAKNLIHPQTTKTPKISNKTNTSNRENNPQCPNNITTIYDKSENAISYIQSNQTIILDPPRAGCDKKLIDHLLEVTPPQIIYLSCNPATQARDVKILLSKYKINSIKTFNFFPRTPHIENLVILDKD